MYTVIEGEQTFKRCGCDHSTSYHVGDACTLDKKCVDDTVLSVNGTFCVSDCGSGAIINNTDETNKTCICDNDRGYVYEEGVCVKKCTYPDILILRDSYECVTPNDDPITGDYYLNLHGLFYTN